MAGLDRLFQWRNLSTATPHSCRDLDNLFYRAVHLCSTLLIRVQVVGSRLTPISRDYSELPQILDQLKCPD